MQTDTHTSKQIINGVIVCCLFFFFFKQALHCSVCETVCIMCMTHVCDMFLAGPLSTPTLSLLSPHTVFSAGEAVRFGCTVSLGHRLNDFHLYKWGVATPLVTQRVDSSQTRVELTLSDVETFHQGSYSCLYRIKGSTPSQLLSSPPSNSINITVGESCVRPAHPPTALWVLIKSMFHPLAMIAVKDVTRAHANV